MTQDGAPWSDSPFWQFSLELYAAPGVKEACLSLQDELGLDVNLVLLSAWLAQHGRRIEPALIEPLLTVSDRHQASIMQPLRQARRSLDPSSAEPWLVPHIAAQRRALLAVELQLERVEQVRLEQLVERAPARAIGGADGLFLDNLLMLYPRISPKRADVRRLAEQVAQPAAAGRGTLLAHENRHDTNKTLG
jgi:uncharacterized protein (TIGR02444 family)